jgi:DNA-binding NarL/FixJ family response regulator
VTRVLIVDGHAVVRAGISALIDGTPDLTVAGTAADAAEAVRLAARLRPQVVLIDVALAGADGVDAIARLVRACPQARVLVLTARADHGCVLGALRAGADGFLLKHRDPDVVLDGIREVAAGGSPLDPLASRVLLTDVRPQRRLDLLTGREREVLDLVADGQPNKVIARRLGISERTVKAHLTSVYHRLGVTDRTQAALWARRQTDPGA